MSGSVYTPFKNKSFARITDEDLSDENLSIGAKLVLTYLGGLVGMTDDGKMNLTLERIAKGVGTAPVVSFNEISGQIRTSIPTRQTERYLKELKEEGMIETEKLKRGIRIWFKEPDTTDLTGLLSDDNLDTTDLTDRPDRSDVSDGSYLFIKNINKESPDLFNPKKKTITTLWYNVPGDIRKTPGVKRILRECCEEVGSDVVRGILSRLRTESYSKPQDYFVMLEKRVREVVECRGVETIEEGTVITT